MYDQVCLLKRNLFYKLTTHTWVDKTLYMEIVMICKRFNVLKSSGFHKTHTQKTPKQMLITLYIKGKEEYLMG